jgi:hypothetical protein
MEKVTSELTLVKDANDALRKDPNLIKKYIEKASPILSRNLIRFEDLRELVKSRILNRDLNSGIKSSFFPWFNRTLKGFRRGEFTIFTGPTGSGKTTFLSQLSLDFAKSGVPTLWCSFELKNEVLLSSMLNQFAGTDLQKEPAKFDYYADQFENIPLYFQTYFGSTHVDDVTTMIDYAIYTHDIGHVVIDNLQFMLSGQGRGIERFEMQDDVIAKLRKLATAKNIHITLVIHPRKGEDNQDLNVSSVFGTAKSTQEADNVLILQLRDKYRVIDIKKNRYDGEIGKSSLWFDRVSKRYEQISAKEIEELLTGTKIEDIIQRKGREIKEDMLTMIDNEGIQTITDPSNPTSTPHPVSENTDQHLHKLLEEKFAPQNPQKSHLYKAFTKVHNIQSNRRKNIEESDLSMQTQHGIKLSVNDNFEPEPFELSGDSIAFNSEADKINYREGVDAKTESSPAKTRKHAGSKVSVEKTKEEINKPATSSAKPQEHRKQQSTEQAEEDPFDVKFEGDYSQIDISVPLNNMPVESPIGSGDQPFAESNLTTAERTQEAASTTQSQSRRGRPANPSKLAMKEVLAGLQARADPPKYIDNLFQEGEVVATYNDMIEELVANNRPRKKGDYSQNKGQYKYNSKETNGQTKVKIMGPSQNTSSKSGNNRN